MTDSNGTAPRTLKLRDREFACKPTMSAKDFGIITRFGSEQIQGDFFELLNGVVRRTLLPESRDAWDALWEEDLEVPVSFEELSNFVNSMLEDAAARPTRPPSLSGPTATTTQTQTPSTGNSESPADNKASTISRSVPV